MTETRSRNCTNHFLVIDDATDSVICTDKGKNTLGGFANIMRRLETRFDGRLRPVADTEGRCWTTPAGQVVRIEQWSKA